MKIAGIGIDLINLSRAERFLKTHSASRVKRLFSAEEQKSRAKLTPLRFAKIFSAKEAFFKTLNESWMGLEGFSALSVSLLSAGRFRVRVTGKSFKYCEADGSFFKEGNLLGAQVIRLKSTEYSVKSTAKKQPQKH